MTKVRLSPAINFIHPQRFDIAFKYNLAYLLEKGIEEDWIYEPYEHHLKVWNNLVEKHPKKIGIEDFKKSFKHTLSSIKNTGFKQDLGVIPVDGIGGYALNGAHRIAASLLYNVDVPYEIISPDLRDEVGCHCDFYYLANRTTHVPNGLSQEYADIAAHQYSKLKSNVRVLSVYPSAEGHEDEVRNLIHNEVGIIYEKWFHLDDLASFNFIRYAYDEDASRGNPWLGNVYNGWPGALSKRAHCFPRPSPLRVYWFEERSPQHTVELKEKIRNIFGIEKHSLHINDTHTETLSISGYLLNPNGLHHLYYAQPTRVEKFDYFFNKFKLWVSSTNLDIEDFCVDSSAVLSAYGLRDCRDLDFLYHGDFIHTGMDDVSCHNEEMKYYQHAKDDIIFNPKNHFYYKGIKFASLDVLRAMKEFRNEEKDRVDVSLIDGLKNNH